MRAEASSGVNDSQRGIFRLSCSWYVLLCPDIPDLTGRAKPTGWDSSSSSCHLPVQVRMTLSVGVMETWDGVAGICGCEYHQLLGASLAGHTWAQQAARPGQQFSLYARAHTFVGPSAHGMQHFANVASCLIQYRLKLLHALPCQAGWKQYCSPTLGCNAAHEKGPG